MSQTRVLIIGASGLVGSHVVTAAMAHPELDVTMGTRTPPGARFGIPCKHVDLLEPASLGEACAGMDAVITLGHQITGGRDRLHAVNDVGARNLVHAAGAAGVTRLIRLSTASVYGDRLGALAGDLHTVRPGSAVSATRAAGDEHVLAAGGLVVRPHLVHAPEDPWVIPRLLQIVDRVGLIENGQTQHSSISAPALGRAMVDLLDPTSPSGVYLAEEEILTITQLHTRYATPHSTAGAPKSCTLQEALAAAPEEDPRWRHDVNFLARDTTFNITGLHTRLAADGTVALYTA